MPLLGSLPVIREGLAKVHDPSQTARFKRFTETVGSISVSAFGFL